MTLEGRIDIEITQVAGFARLIDNNFIYREAFAHSLEEKPESLLAFPDYLLRLAPQTSNLDVGRDPHAVPVPETVLPSSRLPPTPYPRRGYLRQLEPRA